MPGLEGKLLKGESIPRWLPTDRRQALDQHCEEKYRHVEVKGTLVEMFQGGCAFCESKITHVDYGHIEHTRPKSRHPELTFEWSNLLLACGICNGPQHKGDRFPGAAEDGPLINPCEEEPSDHLDFQFDVATNSPASTVKRRVA